VSNQGKLDTSLADLAPREPIQRLTGPIASFLHVEAASGMVLLAFAAAGLAFANSPWAEAFLGFWKTKVSLAVGSFEMSHTLQHWINDGLMGIFFFVVGLEVKREIVLGELRDPRRAALPVAAALGGMIAPALIYLTLQAGTPTARGWGIPMATDIAFVVGCVAVLGSRMPRSLRVMLLSLAIVDDIGAILVIAFGYTASLNWAALACAGVGIAAVVALARLGVRSIGVYVALGAGVWLAFHESGVHATIAGVILGILTPAQSWWGAKPVRQAIARASEFLHGGPGDEPPPRQLLEQVAAASREGISPLARIEDALHPYSAFAIMPLFALANAGVPIHADGLRDPVAIAIAAGLVFGKPIGIVGMSLLAVRIGWARLPEDVTWSAIAGGGLLAGIGFTMSIFIASLALEGPTLAAAKIGILGGSLIAAASGMTVLLRVLPRAAA
jgi:NhaA family Na+:H+ antiporter